MSSPQTSTSQSRSEKKAHHAHTPSRGSAILFLFIAGIVTALLVVFVVARNIRVKGELERSTKSAAQVTVEPYVVKRDDKPHDLILPGNIQANQEATLYARTNGYIKAWYKDIGAKVQEGELIAEIEAPDLDAQVGQAEANLSQARANLDIANLNFERQKDLLTKKVVSQQDFDTARTNFAAQNASVKAGEANLHNLQAQQGFEKIVAPFTGVVTRRNIDVGDLVSAGSSSTQLFTVQQSDPLRIYTYVPQSNATDIHDGMQAKVLVSEFPGRDFEGKVARTAGAIDPASRTLLTEVDIPNPDGTLYAGMYGQVKFTLVEKTPPITIPANTFRFRTNGTQVAVITKDNHIHWQTVKVGRDLGANLEIVSGLDENTSIVVNPTDDLEDGMEVNVKQPAEKNADGKSAGQK